MKICSKCLIEKPLIDFHIRRASKDGRRNTCKSCISVWWDNYAIEKPNTIRNSSIKSKYGITLEQRTAMEEIQTNLCALCGNPSPKRNLAIDHDPKTKRVRGLLCGLCNSSMLGRLEKVGVANVMFYLEKNEDVRPY